MTACLLRPCRFARRVYSSLPNSIGATDASGVPNRPTWSLNQLLASYPRPTLAPHALKRLHDLSALVPPQENSLEYARLRAELEELIRVVEAVKLVDTTGVSPYRLENPSSEPRESQTSAHDGRALLKHAARTKDGFYTVNTDK
ncbi:hypothetical protein C8F01DRAFT_1116452, partial [Mycena amicta]